MRRRQYLKAFGATGTIYVAGCTSDGGSSGGSGNGSSSNGSGGSGYPSHSIKTIVPYGEGGGTDTWQRKLMPVLGNQLDIDINIENMSGASGTRGLGVFLTQRKGPYNLLAHNISIMPSAVLSTRPPFANKLPTLTPLYGYGYNANMIIAKKGTAKNFDQFLKKMKSGEITTVANPGPGSLGEIVFKTMSIRDGYPITSDDWKTVQYESGAASGQAVINGEADAGCTAATAFVRQYDGSNFDPVVSVSSEGVGGMPDLPTVVEAGYPNIDVVGQNTRCQWMPPGTSQDKVDTMAKAISDAVDSDKFQKWSKKTDNPTTHIGPKKLNKLFVQSMKTLPKLLNKESFDKWPQPTTSTTSK